MSYSVIALFAIVLIGVAIFNVLHLGHTKAVIYTGPEGSKTNYSIPHENNFPGTGSSKEEQHIGSAAEIHPRTTATTGSF